MADLSPGLGGLVQTLARFAGHIMAAASISRLARTDVTFIGYWAKLDDNFKKELTDLELAEPIAWAGLLRGPDDEKRDRRDTTGVVMRRATGVYVSNLSLV